MSDDSKPNCSGWTVSTLYTHFEKLLAAQKDAVSIAQTSAERAMLKAENAIERRLESVNEFRATLSDQQRTLIPRPEAELRFKAIEERIGKLEISLSERAGVGHGLSLGWSILIGALGVAGILFGLLKK